MCLLSAVSAMSSVPAVSAVSAVSAMSSVPAVSAVSAMSSVPAVSAVSSAPAVQRIAHYAEMLSLVDTTRMRTGDWSVSSSAVESGIQALQLLSKRNNVEI